MGETQSNQAVSEAACTWVPDTHSQGLFQEGGGQKRREKKTLIYPLKDLKTIKMHTGTFLVISCLSFEISQVQSKHTRHTSCWV